MSLRASAKHWAPGTTRGRRPRPGWCAALLEHAAREPRASAPPDQNSLAECLAARRRGEPGAGRRSRARTTARATSRAPRGARQRDARARAHAANSKSRAGLYPRPAHRNEELAVDLAGVEGDNQVAMRELEDDLGLVEAIGFALVCLLRQDLLDDAELFEAVDVAADRDISPCPAREHEQNVFRISDQDISQGAGRPAEGGPAQKKLGEPRKMVS